MGSQIKKWGIVGLGWLGAEIASRLTDLGQEVWGTTRQNFTWETDAFPAQACDVLLLNTPPLISIPPSDFVDKITLHARSRLIFVSSIGVYGSTSGAITEKTPPSPATQNGVWLCDVEKLLLAKFPTQASILRAGGLIGGRRHPVFSLSRKSEATHKDGPINLIHRDDLIEIIFAVSDLEEPPQILNAVAPYHPLKSLYYNSWSQRLGLNPIPFSSEIADQKIIDSEILVTIFKNWICPELDQL